MLASGTVAGLEFSMLVFGTFGGLSVSMLVFVNFGGLVVSMLVFVTFGGLAISMPAAGTQDRGFEHGLSRRIFWAKKFTACLPSEG
jgi:hypothetical protein